MKKFDELKSELPLRLPAGPKGKGRFGAYYTKLKYNLEWDRLWRVSEQADVVVRFDDFDHRFVFWRGTSYIPCWATYDGAWLTNEFYERRGGSRSGTNSMCEPMSDKQTRYSHVRVLESHDARVVVHWRYSPVDLDYQLPYRDKLTNWGDTVDEYYTIYPDSIAVRNAKIYTSAPTDWSTAMRASSTGPAHRATTSSPGASTEGSTIAASRQAVDASATKLWSAAQGPRPGHGSSRSSDGTSSSPSASV